MQSSTYRDCIALASNQPREALSTADDWLKSSNDVSAYHCRAMALYSLKRYSEAGDTLDAARKMLPESNAKLRSFIARQAALSWVKASRNEAALAILKEQIGSLSRANANNADIPNLTAKLLQERARILLVEDRADEAIVELNRAVSLTPINTELLLERAKAEEIAGNTALARADLKSVLALTPDHAKAREMLNRLGDK